MLSLLLCLYLKGLSLSVFPTNSLGEKDIAVV